METFGTYSLIQYTPDIVRGESFNIGVLLAVDDGKANYNISFDDREVLVYWEITDNFSRLQDILPPVRFSLAREQISHFVDRLRGENPTSRQGIDLFRSRLCNEIRMTPLRKVVIVDSHEKEMDRLMNELVKIDAYNRRSILDLSNLSEDEAHSSVSKFFNSKENIDKKIDALSGKLQSIRDLIRKSTAEEKSITNEINRLVDLRRGL